MKREVILLLLCITLSAATAQTAEDDAARLVTYAARINYFGRLCPRERVYLHFDNTAYFQGETIYYAAYVTDDAGIPNPASRVLYVELLSPTGVIIKQHKLKIVGGRCHGAFQLVDASVKEAIDRRGAAILPSGYYQIRAYTHSMLNFDDAAIFSRVIPVYQLPEREGHYENPVVGEYPYREIRTKLAWLLPSRDGGRAKLNRPKRSRKNRHSLFILKADTSLPVFLATSLLRLWTRTDWV